MRRNLTCTVISVVLAGHRPEKKASTVLSADGDSNKTGWVGVSTMFMNEFLGDGGRGWLPRKPKKKSTTIC